MGAITMRVLLLAGFATLCLCAPAPAPTTTLKESPSNKVTFEDDEYHLSTEDRERIVAGLILQIARDFDEGYITQDELEGRSSVSVRQTEADDVSRKSKDVPVPEEASKSETPSLKT